MSANSARPDSFAKCHRLLVPENIRPVILVLLLATFAPLLRAREAANPRLEKLYATFIAPCCWSKNLTEHNSQVAAEMRSEIDLMVQAGRSDDEIKSTFLAKYGQRVLALPEGAPRVWLFWMPVAVAVAGLILVFFFLKRSTLKAKVHATAPTQA